MPPSDSVQPAAQSLTAHAAAKGAEIHAKYGPCIGWGQLQRILDDRTCVRYPCELAFDASALQPGEFAHPVPRGARPEDGFTMHIHPHFLGQLDRVPWLVLYQLVTVNYGQWATAQDAEVFGAGVLGVTPDEYYRELCRLADELDAATALPPPVSSDKKS